MFYTVPVSYGTGYGSLTTEQDTHQYAKQLTGSAKNQGFLSEGFSRSLTLLAAERLRSSSKAA